MVESPPAGSALEVNLPDAPFLVDTVRAAVQGAGHSVRLLLHPIVGVERDAEGRITRIADAREASGRESVMRLELDRQLDREEGEALVSAVREALAELQLAVGRFPADARRWSSAWRLRLTPPGAVRDPDEVEETAAFLDWLRDGHFILLGARAYERGGRAVDGPRCRSSRARGSASCAPTASRASRARHRSTSCPSSCASASSRAATCS